MCIYKYFPTAISNRLCFDMENYNEYTKVS